MKRLFSISCLLLLVLAMSWTASADTITLEYTGQTGFGPYTALVNGTDYIEIVCIDPANVLTSPWDAEIIPLNGDLSGTRQGGGEAYMQAAWLVNQMYNNTDSPNDDIQAAIWRLMGGEGFGEENDWYEQALSANLSDLDLNRFIILTPPCGVSQEMMTVRPVPEPATMLLLGTGLAGIAAKARRRFKSNGRG